MRSPDPRCPDCGPVSRRDFMKATIGGMAAASAWPLIGSAAEPAAKPACESLVATLHQSLSPEQKSVICMPWEHPLRAKVDANWQITDKTIGELFSADQQQMVREIFLGLHSPEYAETVMKQVEHDSGADGFAGGSAVALFGEPGSGKFEFVLTGRHCTRRCDGDSNEGAAFGGPIFYGHAAQGFTEKPDHPGNAYWYQAKRANEVFNMLDGRQRGMALLGDSRGEHGTETVRLTGKKAGLPGIPVSELSQDQRGLVRHVMTDLLAPFRKVDADEAMRFIDGSGFENLHMAFYGNEDIGRDGVWDVWQIEGPNMVWYFRGKPHVHAWVHVRAQA